MSSEVVNPQITDAVSTASTTSVAEQPAVLSNLALSNLIQNTNQAQENAVSFQQSLNSIQATVLGKVVNMLTTLGPLEAMSAQQLLTGNSLAEELSSLKAAVAAGQERAASSLDQQSPRND